VTRVSASLCARTSLALLAGLVGCGGDPIGPPPPPALVECGQVAPTELGVGQHAVIDPNASGSCVRLPAAGSGGAQHLYAALATNGAETTNGISGGYRLQGSAAATAAAGSPPALEEPTLTAFRPPASAGRFHGMLRAGERALSQSPEAVAFNRGGAASPAAVVPPAVGSKRTFKVLESATNTSQFVDVTATARFVGSRVAIFLDDVVPEGGYTDADLADVGQLFDDHLYRIDTTAFGRESDIDNNEVVVVLLTDAVNALSTDCENSVILGYFFGLDLLQGAPNSNNGEVFYGLVPDEAGGDCQVTKSFATGFLAPTFIHEFQHMISFNQHFLLRGGSSEDTWLNEGLSHFAEELGGREIPDAECQPAFTSCRSQFASGNLLNAYNYLADPEDHFLIEPGSSSGTLEERGANWLFVRWLGDHFSANQPLATDLTRRLVQTSLLGARNVEAATGEPFSQLVTEWQLANYVEGVAGFTAASPRLQYSSWDFRGIYSNPLNPFERDYPLIPDVTSGSYQQAGTLRAGSGRHVLVDQGAGAGPVELKLTSGTGGVLPDTLRARIGLVRVR
jgi:hypothetical protein